MPSGKPTVGVDDLATLFPDIAEEAYGWDPSKFKSGSNKKLKWICNKGHEYEASPYSRTGDKTGCPYCAGKKVLSGFNDLKTRYPKIALEADGWDPGVVMPGTVKKHSWKCTLGHKWDASPNSRTNCDNGCPFCGNKRCWPGFNDLQTKYPEVAKEAFGWDPSLVMPKTSKKLEWKCTNGDHTYLAAPAERTGDIKHQTGCPYCSNRKFRIGINDLKTKYPKIASEAHKWDPSTEKSWGLSKKEWKCTVGHIFHMNITDRILGRNCNICAGKVILKGFNDLASCHPALAAQALGWDPKTVSESSGKNLRWKCPDCAYEWNAVVGNRSKENGSGCPNCCIRGFKPDQDAWLYLMAKPGEQQIGITNDIEARRYHHGRSGFVELDSIGPLPGKEVQLLERKFKQWLKKNVQICPGTQENWYTNELEVQSLKELRKIMGIITELIQ